MGSQSVPGSDHQVMNGSSGNEKRSESFVVDFENIGYGLIDKDNTATHNSKIITLQRNLSRKGTPTNYRSVDRKSERENSSLLLAAASSSPKAAQLGSSTPEKPGPALTTSPPREEANTMGGATTEHHHSASVNPLAPQHQISIKTGGSGTITNAAGPPDPVEKKRWGRRSYSFRRSSHAWFSDPKRILLFFATLSSVGTMSLIYFTITMTKSSGENNDLDRLPPQL